MNERPAHGRAGSTPSAGTKRPGNTRKGGRSLLFAALLLALPLAAAASPAAGTLVFSIQEIDCQSCGQEIAKMLKRQKGVRQASFDILSAEITLERTAEAPTADELLEIVHRAGYKAVNGAGLGSYLDPVEFDTELDVGWISRAGEAAVIQDHLVPGKVTVVDFYAVWCGPCREVDEEMRNILATDSEVALRKINIVDWQSPIAQQELRNVEGLPHVRIYDKDGKRVAQVAGLNLERLRRAISRAKR